MRELRELLARASQRFDYDGDAGTADAVWDVDPDSHYNQSYLGFADAIIAALKANGLAVVPTTITQEMLDEMCYDTWEKDFQPFWRDCLAASPYAKEFE